MQKSMHTVLASTFEHPHITVTTKLNTNCIAVCAKTNTLYSILQRELWMTELTTVTGFYFTVVHQVMSVWIMKKFTIMACGVPIENTMLSLKITHFTNGESEYHVCAGAKLVRSFKIGNNYNPDETTQSVFP